LSLNGGSQRWGLFPGGGGGCTNITGRPMDSRPDNVRAKLLTKFQKLSSKNYQERKIPKLNLIKLQNIKNIQHKSIEHWKLINNRLLTQQLTI